MATIVKRRIKWNNIIILILILICLTMLTISLTKIVKWNKDNKDIDNQINNIENSTTIKETQDNENTEIINQDLDIPKSNPYWDYIKMNLIDVDFTELKQTNSDVIGWIQVNGTNINYPFVQTNDNSYYLTHAFNKSYNDAGWVFLDYRNNDTNNRNTIIYAHSRLDKTMFGTLKKIMSNGWLNDTNNYIIKISTEKENTLWQVFSTYIIPNTSDYIQTSFNSDKDYLNFLNMIKNRSEHDFNTTINENDNILTLSTCYNDNEKTVVHAKLIKREIK